MSITKKIISVSVSLTTAVWLSGAAMFVPMAQAATVSELQAQINALLSQIQLLQTQLGLTQSQQTSSFSFTKDLTLGSKGDDVKALQDLLISASKGSAAAALSAVGATSFFGNLTKAALAEYQAAAGVSPAAGYFGPKTRAYVASLGGTTTGGTTTGGTTTGGTTTTTSGLTLALASDNPAAATIPSGVTGSNFLKFTVSGKGTLSSLSFKRNGLGAVADFVSSGLYLYDGATRLTSGRSLNSTTHEISFLNLALAVDGTKTLSLVADIATSSVATAGAYHYFTLVLAAGDPTPTGTLTSNVMTIGSAAVGTVTATSGAAPSNPKVGEKSALVAEFKLAANSTEDITISRISLTEGGSITNANLTNLVLKQGGATVATASAIGDKDLATLVLTTPFLLEKGQERTFMLYADISGSTRTSDTIVFYFDSKADVIATGKTYGYSVTVDISAMDVTTEGDTLTIAGGDVTITLNGPVAGDVAVRGQDVALYDFTMVSKNNVEVRSLRFNASTTGTIALYNDFKIWDTATNAVITSATNIATGSSSKTFTDIINLTAGVSKRFKATADVDSTNTADGTIIIRLLAFESNDIKNLDNNTYVAVGVIVPNGIIVGNTQTAKAPTIDLQLAASPTSQTYVQGVKGTDLTGFSLRAISADIKISSIKVTASSSTGTITTGEVQSLGLYDGTTLVSSLMSLASDLTVTFDNLNLTILKGATKVLTLRGDISANATDADVYYFYIAGANSTYLTVYDKDGNSATITGTAANSGPTVSHTITTAGNVSVAVAADDNESEAGIVVAGTEGVLAKFRFTSTNEEMTINKMQLLVVPTSSATATSTASADEVPTVKLYEGSTQVGATAGYTVTASGDNSGTVYIQDLNWKVTKNGSKTLTVKGVLNTIAGGSDTGANVYVSVMAAGFEAQGQSAKDTTLTAATGNQKLVYKTQPTIAAPTLASTKLTVGQIPLLNFAITASSQEQVAWKQIQFKISMTAATMTAVNAVPGTSGSALILRHIETSTNLNIASGFSSSSATTGEQTTITGGNTGYVSLLLNTEQVIPAGTTKTYELQLTFSDISATVGAASVVAQIHRGETATVSSGTVSGVRGGLGNATDAAPSFVWSDYSDVSHTESTSDWNNGMFVKNLPSAIRTISN
ncbi:MAG: hypothetical protein AAB514_01265 [Patescibacteria group bacterium]